MANETKVYTDFNRTLSNLTETVKHRIGNQDEIDFVVSLVSATFVLAAILILAAILVYVYFFEDKDHDTSLISQQFWRRQSASRIRLSST